MENDEWALVEGEDEGSQIAIVYAEIEYLNLTSYNRRSIIRDYRDETVENINKKELTMKTNCHILLSLEI